MILVICIHIIMVDQRCVFAREQMGTVSTHYVHALIDPVQVPYVNIITSDIRT